VSRLVCGAGDLLIFRVTTRRPEYAVLGLAIWIKKSMVQVNMETIMTQYENRLLDDLAKVFTSAAGAAQGVRSEIETLFHSQAERLLADLDLVSREEFEVSQDMVRKAREENEALSARLDALEAAIAAK